MKIAMISKGPRIKRRFELSTGELFRRTGNNTGNLAFCWAADDHILGEKFWFDWDFDPNFINDHFDLVVLVCANMINNEIDLTILCDRIEAISLPMTAFSIGTQSAFGEPRLLVNPSVERFVNLICSKCRSIGLRGSASAEFLEVRALTNFRVIGCPSNFISYLPNLSDLLALRRSQVDKKLAYHAEDLGSLVNLEIDMKIRSLFPESVVVKFIQSPFEWLDACRVRGRRHISESHEAYLRRSLFVGRDSDHLDDLRRDIRAYFDIDDWLEAMSDFDFSCGPRLHGNIVAAQAGLSCMILVHDGRVQELASTIGLPMMTLDAFSNLSGFEELWSICSIAFTKYDSIRSDLAREYVSLLSENGVPFNPRLREIYSGSEVL